MNRSGLRLVFWLVALAAPTSALGATLYVDAAATTPYSEIQDAIDDALDGDTVLVFAGTYAPIDFLGKDLVVVADGGPLNTTIDAAGTGAAVVFDNAEPPTALLQGFTLTGGVGLTDAGSGFVLGGGLVIRRGAEPRISGNVITGNTAEYGGGVAVAGGAPSIYGNTIEGNTATEQGGGAWFQADPAGNSPTLFSCNLVRDNSGVDSGGIWMGLVEVHATNNRIHANSGERGGIWVTASAAGYWHNNTITANVGDAAGAGGVENNSTVVDFVNNIFAFNSPGFGAIRDSAAPVWAYNDVFGNTSGDYGGSAGDPTGVNGNVLIDPLFTAFTAGNAYDDDLSLLPTSQLINFGDPDPAFLDLDGQGSDIGFTGGPHTDCDLDGDGVRPSDTPADCIPDDAAFFPGSYEGADGLDHDCDGFGTADYVTLIPNDGGLTATGEWEYGDPTSVPGIGHLAVNAWCTNCGGVAAAGTDSTLDFTADFSAVTTAGTGVRLQFAHAYDNTALASAGIIEVDIAGTGTYTQVAPVDGYPVGAMTSGPLAGTPSALGTFGGDAGGWILDSVDLSAYAGTSVAIRWRYAEGTSPLPGWTVGTIQVQVEDADGDGRAADLQDCDDGDLFTYFGAPEIAYDSIDQDCDGSDLVDVDGDGFIAGQVGGPDCDDSDATAFPGGTEIPYDGIDQDCIGGDLNDLDEDGWIGGPDGDDCDDDDDSIHPTAAEVPYDSIDQDCDGSDLVDVDGDGYDGDRAPPFGDCDDEDASVNPGEEEVCGDEVDNDCDERVDVVDDGDGDGVDRCAGDCDDADPAVAAGLPEICDGLDNDCDGVIPDDESDDDGDLERVCDGDCDDSNAAVAAGMPEICDRLDNDCDGAVDEDHDRDLDGYSERECGSDCDDQLRNVYPGAPVDCTPGADNDCDGVFDIDEPACTGATTSGGGCTGSGARIGPRSPTSTIALLIGMLGLVLRRRSQRS